MGLFDFLKKLLKSDETTIVTTETIQFTSLATWMKDKKTKLSLQEKEVQDELQATITAFSKEVEAKLLIVKKINVEDIDAEARLKYIAGNSFRTYISLVEHLMKYINSLPFENLEDYSEKLENYFVDFFKKSRVPHQRSTLLVDKELAEVKDTLIKFYKKQKSIFDSNLELRKTLSIYAFIQEQLSEIKVIEKNSKHQTKKINELKKNTQKNKKAKESLLEKISSLEKDKTYLENIKKKREVEIETSRLNNEYLNVKRLINFKALTNEFHNSAKYMKIVKSYKDSFRATLQTKGDQPLLELLKEAKIELQPIEVKLQEIKTAKKNLLKKEKTIQDDVVIILQLEIKQLDRDLLQLEKESAIEAERFEKIIKNKQDIIASLREEFLKMNVVLEDDS